MARVLLISVEFVAWAVNNGSGHCDWDPYRRGLFREMFYNLVQWDACNYVAIAQQGYPDYSDAALRGYFAWPPLYPMVIKAFDLVVPGNAQVAAIVASNLAALAFMIIFARFVQMELARESAYRTVLVFAAFPAALFMIVAYSESLYLLLAVSSLYLARRGRWWWAGGVAALAGATRVVGLLIVLALAYEYLRQRDFSLRRIRVDALALFLVPSGLVLYALYLWLVHGDPLIFLETQKLWGRELAPPWTGLADVFSVSMAIPDRVLAMRNLLDLFSALLMPALLALGVFGPWRLRRDQVYILIFGAVPFLVALMQPIPGGISPLMSLNRFAIAVIPAFMVLGKMLARPAVLHAYLFAALPLQAGLLLLYISGRWAG